MRAMQSHGATGLLLLLRRWPAAWRLAAEPLDGGEALLSGLDRMMRLRARQSQEGHDELVLVLAAESWRGAGSAGDPSPRPPENVLPCNGSGVS